MEGAMKRNTIFSLFALVMFTLMIAEPALAGPGGKIASAAFETFWGKMTLGALTIIFLPLIIWVLVREKLSERRARKDLRFMAGYSHYFEWL